MVGGLIYRLLLWTKYLGLRILTWGVLTFLAGPSVTCLMSATVAVAVMRWSSLRSALSISVAFPTFEPFSLYQPSYSYLVILLINFDFIKEGIRAELEVGVKLYVPPFHKKPLLKSSNLIIYNPITQVRAPI